MTSRFPLGTYFKYMIADKTSLPEARSPVHNSAMPLYLGRGPAVPTVSFVHNARAYNVEAVLEEGRSLNPFPCPLVMAIRQKEVRS